MKFVEASNALLKQVVGQAVVVDTLIPALGRQGK